MPVLTAETIRKIRFSLDQRDLRASDLADELGVAPSSVSRWLHGGSISRHHRARLLKHIRESAASGRTEIASLGAQPVVPVISSNAAKAYDAAVQAPSDFLNRGSRGKRVMQFPWARESDVVVVVDEELASARHPPGALLLCRPDEYPLPGDLALARTVEGDLAVGRYLCGDGRIELRCENPARHPALAWDRGEASKVLWWWPVVSCLRFESRWNREKPA